MNIVDMNAASAAAATLCAAEKDTIGIPAGFQALPDGIYQATEGESGDPTWLCSPITVKAVFRTASGSGWGRIITVADPDGTRQDLSLLDSEIERSPGSARARLTDSGLKLRSGTSAREAFTRLIREWKPDTVLTSTDRLGWSDAGCTAFGLCDGRVLGDGQFHFTGHRSDDGSCAPAGTVDGWRDNVAALCIDNPLMTLAISLAFTGPLLELLNEEGGGLHLHGASSCGKTTIQRLATSVWRNPARVGSWRVTANGAEEVARAANSILLPLDEIAEISGEELHQATYMLANGTGKVRANAQGSSKPPARWRVAILSTGEISVAQKIAEGRRQLMAGQTVRLLDLDADSGRYGAFDELHESATAADFADNLKRASMDYHGTAGPAFVERLITNGASVSRSAHGFIDKFVKKLGPKFSIGDDGQKLRVARRLAVIACAGEMATKFGLTGWRRGDANAAAHTAMGMWIEARRVGRSVVSAEALEGTRAFLTAQASGFAAPAGSGGFTPPGAHGWKDAGLFFVTKESWHALHGEAATEVAKDLAAMGLLRLGEGRNICWRMPRWAGSPRARVYAIREQILNESVSVDAA